MVTHTYHIGNPHGDKWRCDESITKKKIARKTQAMYTQMKFNTRKNSSPQIRTFLDTMKWLVRNSTIDSTALNFSSKLNKK